MNISPEVKFLIKISSIKYGFYMKGFFKFYLDVSKSSNDVDLLSEKFVQKLSKIARIQGIQSGQYWKIQNYFEVKISLAEVNTISVDEVLHKVLEPLAAGWLTKSNNEEHSFIWERNGSNCILDSRICWMNLELYP